MELISVGRGSSRALQGSGMGEKIPLPESACSVCSPVIAPVMPTAVSEKGRAEREA